MIKKILLFLLTSIAVSLSSELHATHLLGSDLSYECLGPGQYRVTLTLYRDCNGVSLPNSTSVSYSSAACGVNGTIQVSSQGPPVDITPNCPSVPSACGGSGNYGIQEWVYSGILNLPPGCGDDWILGWSSCCRNNAINTLNNAGSQNMFIGANLNNTISPICNSSPTFNNSPGSIVCVNQPVVYNHGVSDLDGDSLFFSLGNCLQNPGSGVNYAGGFNATSPLTTASGVSINSSTGAITFTPTSQQVGVLCVNVREYRNGALIGNINRDMQFTVIACSNVPPQASGVNGAPNTNPINFSTSICANGDLCFTINGTDPNTNNVTMSWNAEIPGATFVVTNNGTPSPSAEFCWNPGPSDIGQNIFTVNVEDDACPIIGQGTYTYIIDVIPSPNTLSAGPIDTICFGESSTLNATSIPVATSYTWTPSASLSSATGASVVASPFNTTVYSLSATFPDGCNLTAQTGVIVLQRPNVVVNPSNAFNCSGQANDLTAVVSGSPIANYTWTPGGQTTPSVTVFPTTSTTYSVTATDIFGCSSTASSSVTIAAPTGNVCNVLYVTPTGSPSGIGSKNDPMDLETALEVGACNGTVVKMAVGDYITDTVINKITSYITLEGGFDPAINWDKISTAGASRILRTATQSYSLVSTSIALGSGIVNEAGPNPEVVAIGVSNQTGFRFQDLTIETELNSPGNTMAGYQGPNIIGVRLNSCEQYSAVRTQIIADDGGNGADRIWSIAATDGGNSRALEINTNGVGGNLIQTNLQTGTWGAGGSGVGGPGAAGPNGAPGTSNNLTITGTALASNVNNFNLAAQPTIRMEDIACTETVMNLSQTVSNSWSFGAGSTPNTANGALVSTQYSSIGRKNISYGANAYTGFANIILDSQVLPTFNLSAPFVQGQYRICAGSSVDFYATNGGVGYIYEWDLGGGALPNNYSGVAFQNLIGITFDTPGIYPITLNFVTNCCGASIPTIIDLYVEENPSATIIASDTNFCNGSNAPINLTAYDSISFGQISWSPIAGLDSPSSFSVNALPGDTISYVATITDSTGLCSEVNAITLNVINIELSTSVVNTFCGPDGSATVTAAGGSGTYTYQWSANTGGQTTATATNLAVDIYDVFVTDAITGCIDSAQVVVNAGPGALVGFVSNTTAVSCIGNGDGNITVSITGGTPPFDYVWSPSGGSLLGTTNTSHTTSLLDGGNYDVLITDWNGCTFNVSAFIPEPDSLIIEMDSMVNPTCIGAQDGFIEILVDGGVGPYTIVWDDVDTTQGYILDSLGVGTYCVGVLDASGCFDTMCFTLSAPLLTDSIFDTICQFQTYTLPNGSIVSPMADTSSIDSFTNIIGCDSIVSTFLTVYPVYQEIRDTILCIGQSFQAPNGLIFAPSADTSFIDSFNTINACDSTIQINIQVQDFVIDSIDTTICSGQNILVNGVSYNSPGLYFDTIPHPVTNCDSIQFVINLMVDTFSTVNIDTTICEGQSILVNGVTYANNGTFNDTARYSASNCDSIIYSIIVNVDTIVFINIDTTICQGQSINVNGVSYSNTGIFNDTIRYSQSGCDSIQYLIDLQVDSVIVDTINQSLCQGDTFTLNGMDYTSDGLYFDTLVYTSSLCDSIQYVINLQFDNVNVVPIDTILCQGQSITINGVNYDSTGTYLDTIRYTLSGCDSIQYVIDLQVDPLITTIIDTAICQGETLQVNGANYTATGLYADTIFHASGCLSQIFNINLLVNTLPTVIANASDTLVCVNNSLSLFGTGAPGTIFTWDNGVFNNTPFNPIIGSNEYIVTGIDANNCVNMDTINIVGLAISLDTNRITICEDETYTLPDATIVNTAGSYSVTLNNGNNCDSTIVTILNVNQIGSFTPLVDAAVCDGLSQTFEISTQNMNSFEWFVNDGSGNQSLLGNSDYSGADTNLLSFNLDTTLHQNIYTVEMIDECGNIFTESVSLDVYNSQLVDNPLADTTFCAHEINALTVNYNGNNYVWNDGTTGPSILPTESGTYIVEFIENITNCLLSDTIEVSIEDCIANCVVLAPTGFSPNESGANDIFRVVTTCDEGFSAFQFNIYNRWGELVYSSNDWREGWDGSYKGREAEIGTYTYYVEYTKQLTNKKEMLKGNVTLIK